MTLRISIAVICLISAIATPAAASEHRVSSETTKAKIEALIAGEDRPHKQKARDKYRHPLKTLTFCGVEQDRTVAEIWPGEQRG